MEEKDKNIPQPQQPGNEPAVTPQPAQPTEPIPAPAESAFNIKKHLFVI